MNLWGFLWYFWLHQFWIIGIAVDVGLCLFPTTQRRMRKGVISRWVLRNFGATGLGKAQIFLILIFITPALMTVPLAEPYTLVFVSLYWTALVSWRLIDLVTGGDDPTRRFRRRVSDAVKKLKISAPPRPAIDLR